MSQIKKTSERLYKDLFGIVFLVIGIFFGICLISYNPADPALNSASNFGQISNYGGKVGAYLADILFTILGISAYVLCGALVLLSITQFRGKIIKVRWRDAIAYFLLIIAASTLLHLRFETVEVSGYPISGGGLIGSLLGVILQNYFNKGGAYLIATAFFAIMFFYSTHISVKSFLKGIRISVIFLIKNSIRCVAVSVKGIKTGSKYIWPLVLATGEQLKKLLIKLFKLFKKEEKVKINRPTSSHPKNVVETLAIQNPVKPIALKEAPIKQDIQLDNPKIFGRIDKQKNASGSQLELAHIRKGYTYPPLSLLDTAEQVKTEVDEDSLKKNSIMLHSKLIDYSVEGKITEIHPGPVITMYEFEPAAGVKINKIVGLADDLAVAMGGRSIRVVPHLPGKAAIGIEIPNNVREIVWLKDIIGDSKFTKSYSKLTMALGKNTQGLPVVTDLTKMPHMLIAGATGSGKSVAINAIICSILYKSTPEEVRMIMVDPKTLELSGYNGIPHLLLPVVTQPKQANLALCWALREMEHRYKLLSDLGVKNIATYNTKLEKDAIKLVSQEEAMAMRLENPDAVTHTGKLPYIVIIIDELADLMMVSSKDIEENITRLAQMARAAGIHLIVATQRPSVDVITGLIKANFPTRIAFKVSSKHDSRTIIDTVGAEHLLGAGDMLFVPPNASNMIRIHGAYVTEGEIERVVKHLKDQGEPVYDETILQQPTSTNDEFEGEHDELYDAAVRMVAETKQASISMIQRKLRIGYNRAARMVEKMEAEGVVGPADGSKPREVYITNA